MSHGVIWPKMADHLYEPETYFMDETPGLSSVFLAQQNVKIRIGIEQQICANHFPKGEPICRKDGVCNMDKVTNNFEFLTKVKLKG